MVVAGHWCDDDGVCGGGQRKYRHRLDLKWECGENLCVLEARDTEGRPGLPFA